MKILGEVKGYLIHETGNGKYFLCKILKEYGQGSEAQEKCRNNFFVKRRMYKVLENILIHKIYYFIIFLKFIKGECYHDT